MVWKKNSLGVKPLKKLLATKPRPVWVCVGGGGGVKGKQQDQKLELAT
jgi:hypothetical protein